MSDSGTSSELYIREKLERWDPEFFVAESFMTADLRPGMRTVFTLRAEFRALLLESSHFEVALARLGWWREEWQRVLDGKARHPLGRSLMEADAAALAKAPFDAVLGGMGRVLDQGSAESLQELRVPWDHLAELLTAVEQALVPEVADAASWRDIVAGDLVRDLPTMLARGHGALPMDVIAEVQVSRQDVVAGGERAAPFLNELARRLLSGGTPVSAAPSEIYRGIARRRLQARAEGRSAPGPLRLLMAAWEGTRRMRRQRLRG